MDKPMTGHLRFVVTNTVIRKVVLRSPADQRFNQVIADLDQAWQTSTQANDMWAHKLVASPAKVELQADLGCVSGSLCLCYS